MELIKTKREHYDFLYRLLTEKDEIQNISHEVLPSYVEHVQFNEDIPYVEDYIIWEDGPKGRLYVTDRDEIGIAIAKEFQSEGLGGKALDKILESGKPYLANIAPANLGSQKFFEKHGFKLIQYTYKYGGK